MAEATKDQLQQQLADLTRQFEDSQHALATFQQEAQTQHDALLALTAEKNQLQDLLTTERTRSGEAADDLNTAEKLIEELQQRLDRADARQALSDTVIVSDGTHDYKVLAPKFKFDHVDYTAEQLRADEALVAKLVEAGVGCLQKVEAA